MVGGECAVELFGVLQLLRKPDHLQQNVEGVSRRVPRGSRRLWTTSCRRPLHPVRPASQQTVACLTARTGLKPFSGHRVFSLSDTRV